MSDYVGGENGPPQGYSGGDGHRGGDGRGSGGFRPPGGGSGMGLLVVALVVVILFVACQDRQGGAALPADPAGAQQLQVPGADR